MWSLSTAGKRIVIVLVIAIVRERLTVWIITTVLKKKMEGNCGLSVGAISTDHPCQLSTQNTVSVVVCR